MLLPDEKNWQADLDLTRAALRGDLSAMETLLAGIRTPVYNLALRFLWDPDDSEDATQEILLRVVTRLHTFQGRARFSTWAYRVAVNYLIDARQSRAESRRVSFEKVARSLRHGSREPDFVSALEQESLAEQVKTACTHAMLLCLNREQRLAFLVGEVLGLSGREACYVLDLSEPNYRKRLSRARSAMHDFLHANCGLMESANACRCHLRIEYGRRTFEPYLRLAENRSLTRPRSIPELQASGLRGVERLAMIYRSNPQAEASPALLRRIRALFSAKP